MTDQLTLESPVMREAQELYEKSRIALWRGIPFEDWANFFSRGDSYRMISKATGLHIHRIVWCWKGYFKPWLKEIRLKAVLERLQREARDRADNQLATLPEGSAIRIVVDAALAAGCNVELKSYTFKRVLQRKLIICGKSVLIYEARKVQRHRGTHRSVGFGMTRNQIEEADLIACVTNVPGHVHLFLLDRNEVIRTCFAGTERKTWKIRTALERPPPRSRRVRGLDLWLHEDEAVTKLFKKLLAESPS